MQPTSLFLGFLLVRLFIFNFIVKTKIRNFTHWPGNWPFIEILRKTLKVGTKVELHRAVWFIGESKHWSSRIVTTTVKILESYTLAYAIFKEWYLTSCTQNRTFETKLIFTKTYIKYNLQYSKGNSMFVLYVREQQ